MLNYHRERFRKLTYIFKFLKCRCVPFTRGAELECTYKTRHWDNQTRNAYIIIHFSRNRPLLKIITREKQNCTCVNVVLDNCEIKNSYHIACVNFRVCAKNNLFNWNATSLACFHVTSKWSLLAEALTKQNSCSKAEMTILPVTQGKNDKWTNFAGE